MINLQNFRMLRIAKGLTQTALAKKIHSNAGYISLIEHEKVIPSFEFINRVAKGLDCQVITYYCITIAGKQLKLSLKALRKLRRVTQQDIADICICDKSQISQAEGGKILPSLRLLENIGRALRCEIQIMFAFDIVNFKI